MELPTDYLSPSQVGMYQRCAKQYEFRYVDGIIRPPSVALVEGSSYHEALELNNGQKIDSHEDLPPEEVVEKFSDEFSDRSKEIEDWEGEKKDAVIERGTGLLNLYMAETSPVIQPVAVEKQFTMPLHVNGETIDVTGFIDTETEDRVLDYKGVGRAKSQGDADDDLQLATYGAASGQETAEFVCLVKTKTPKVVRVETKIDDARKQWAAKVIASVAQAISAGVFPLRSPVGWECSEKFCGYWHMCRGKRG